MADYVGVRRKDAAHARSLDRRMNVEVASGA